jgi:ATP phosphoribosyltransferase regulatory subunit
MTEDHFTSWGYLPVLTPVFDYFETYRPLLDRKQVERSYRFPDRAGELLMLRSDITLFLAKQMGLTLGKAPLPARVYYADSIIRHQEEEDISSDEFFQSGAELIGLEGREGDLEVLTLLYTLLEDMRLPNWQMHIGSRALLDAVLEDRVNAVEAGDLLEIRDREGLCRLMTDSGLENPLQRTELLLFLGTPQEFAAEGKALIAACGSSPGITAVRRAVNVLETLAADLTSVCAAERIRIDLSEHGGQPYYTGFTVSAYAEGANSAIASGGRYDKLLGAFGAPLPAAGFSLMMRKIEPLSAFASEAADSAPISGARGKDFIQRFQDARSRRASGERVVLSAPRGGAS